MSENLNQFNAIGRMTRAVELRDVGEHKVGGFSLAINGRKDTDVLFMDCKIWNKQAEVLAQYADKGSKIQITGKLSLEKWEKDGVKNQKIVCLIQSFEFLDSKKDSTQTATEASDRVLNGFNGSKVDNPFDDSAVPF